jgi:tRNA dimethylallyltransferase
VKKNLIVTLMGPTGVGKTDLIIELYSQIPITIISVDSIQIYKDLNIGSGKPSNEVLKKYPHELIDFVEPTESYSTARFKKTLFIVLRIHLKLIKLLF